MEISEKIFKAYDVRGLVGTEITNEVFYRIGHAYVGLLKEKGVELEGKSLMVGYDMRETSIPFSREVIRAWKESGISVIDIGLVSTPLFNFAVASSPAVAGGIMVTASHNPSEYNGCKLVFENALPIGKGSGMERVKSLVLEGYTQLSENLGEVKTELMQDSYVAYLQQLVSFDDIPEKTIVIDYGNGVGSASMNALLRALPQVTVVKLYEEPDGTFPNHEANPLKTETLDALCKKVKEVGAAFGLALDGDSDRIGLVDEEGIVIEASFVGALFGLMVLEKHPKSHMLYDLRSSAIVPELWEAEGATTQQSVVGHALIKKMIKETGATFASELSLHLYFGDTYGVESPEYALLLLLRKLGNEKRPLSSFIEPMKKYAHSGEINFHVEDKDAAKQRIVDAFQDKANRVTYVDGVSMTFDWGWFNVRESNTEPVLRLNLEAWNEEDRNIYTKLVTEAIEG